MPLRVCIICTSRWMPCSCNLGLAMMLRGPEAGMRLQVLSSETEETLNGFFRFHADCSNTWQRKIAVSYAADFETGEDPTEVSERVMEVCLCAPFSCVGKASYMLQVLGILSGAC